MESPAENRESAKHKIVAQPITLGYFRGREGY